MTKKTLILIGFITLKFFLQYITWIPEYDLHRDEYLHLDQGNHLAWGFLSVPPFTSWISFLILQLGNSIFWIKFFPALFGALTLAVVWKTIEELNGDLFALILGASCILFSALVKINNLYQPNSFDVLSWTTLYFVILKYYRTADRRWLYAGAVVFAAGFLNKYNIAFLIIGIIPAVAMSKQRSVFKDPSLYYASLLGLLLISPNLYWQYNNHFPVIHHLKELSDTQLVHVDRLGFLKSQLLFFIGSILVIFASFYALVFYKPFGNYRFFFFAIVFTLAAFLYFRAKDYYAIGIYPVYIAFGAVYLSHILKNGRRRYVKPLLAAIPLLMFLAFYRIAFPSRSPGYIAANSAVYKELGMLRWEDGKDHASPQDFADMLGWRELAQKTDSIYSKLPNKGTTLVLCDNYGQAGAINYYTNENIKAVSFNADYINWIDLNKKYENLIRVKERDGKDTELKETSPFFQTAALAASVTNQYAREFGTSIFSFANARIDINDRIAQEINERKTSSGNP